MKNRISLNIDHPNTKRMEFFLNRVDVQLKEVALDWPSWKLSVHISGGAKFISEGKSPVSITVLLCDSYHAANEIAKANALPASPHARWSVNGDLLYVVESGNTEKVSEILSLFAGEE
jgi:hypothetical protein